MTKKIRPAVIYVPGLGDSDKLTGQRLLVSTWRLWGVKPYVCQMKWGDGEAFAPKFERLLALIDTLAAGGNKVSLVGVSAGAGTTINAFAARKDKVNGVVCICGKVNNPQSIGGRYRSENPAFVKSAEQVQPSLDKLDFKLDRTRVQSRYAIFDGVVTREDSQLAGGVNKTVPGIGHVFTIATQLLFGAPYFLRFLEKLTTTHNTVE
jgi:pimeloyl-ACP methyl ester carboxylesterase